MSFNRLTWGVKASFRSYVQAAGGATKLSEGASQTDDGTFVFQALPGGSLTISPDGNAAGSMRFQGAVSFEAHGGMLNVTLNELGLDAEEDGLMLTALEAPMNQGRCAIAKLTLLQANADQSVSLRAEMTMDGMYQIADNYPPGTELDPVQLD